jgi:hypothetical protein
MAGIGFMNGIVKEFGVPVREIKLTAFSLR